MKLRDQKKEVESLKGYSKNEISEFKKQIDISYDRQLNRITEMVILISDLPRGFILRKFNNSYAYRL